MLQKYDWKKFLKPDERSQFDALQQEIDKIVPPPKAQKRLSFLRWQQYRLQNRATVRARYAESKK